MIQRVSQAGSVNMLKNNKKQLSSEKAHKFTGVRQYADSFVKHAAESTPMLLGLTGAWAFIDHAGRGLPLKKTLANNFNNFFLPVLIVSSAILAGLENKQVSGKEK